MSMKSLFLAIPVLLLGAPAAAVIVTDISASGMNSAAIVTAAPGLLEADVAIHEFSPIILSLLGEEADAGSFAFNSVVDIFTAVELGVNVGSLDLSLAGGATFAFVGDVVPAFSFAELELNGAADRLTIRFKPQGEAFGVVLGSIFGGEDFRIALPDEGTPFTFSFNATAVPEPASWALLIAGFGIMGVAARRRRTLHHA